ncbi:MAG: hypothetical protein B6I35_05935 [Anaerolineaceae bacterium 4572_32.2]|nr:MAG: hypothetical protein B6I35_05935 [Anaerolineaceae bacterium 4572_32.2]
MSLEHAILGLLRYQPLSGYDLKKAIDTSVRHFWPADQSQIYRTLSRMAERGWVEVEVVPQEDRPNRKVYRVTEAGQEELGRWLTTPLPPNEPRLPWLIQVFFAGQLSDEEILVLFEREAGQLRARLERYEQIPQESAEYVEAVGSPREAFFWMLTLEYGNTVNLAELEWIESVIERLGRKEHPSE